jgi:penicillin-binding protein 1C
VAARTSQRRFLALCVLALPLGFVASIVTFHALAHRLALAPPPPTVLLLDASGRHLADVGGEGRGHGYWPLDGSLPDRIVQATLAAEDARFRSHPGVDPRSVARALIEDLRQRRVAQGASTLAMQVARLEAPGPRTLWRKAVEAVVALGITGRHGRDAVLRHYLTIAPYGNDHHGIAYAARRYFDKPVQDLSWAECALLASLPRMPGKMNVHRHRGRQRAERRARYVLARLRALGAITEPELAQALDQLPGLRPRPREPRPASALHAILSLERDVRSGRLRPRRADGYALRTSLDLDVQAIASRVAAASIDGLREDGAGNLAVIVADVETGRVRAYVGSAGYRDPTGRGAIDYARVPRSPGSALKPFIYGLGLSVRGFTGATILSDVGLLLDPRRGRYDIHNYDGGHLGPILYRHALANSRNIPAFEVLNSVGVERAYRHLQELGLVRRWRDPAQYGLSLALGSMHVTLFDLVRAYGVLASGGTAFDLGWSAAARPRRHRARTIPEDVARQITSFLSDPIARLPSFPRMGWLEYPFPVAVKTGTSQGFRDAWCVAYSRTRLVGAWVGHADNAPMKRRCGADSAAAIVHRVMAALHPEEMRGLNDVAFAPPRGWIARRIDMLSGKLARDDTPCATPEWFAPGTEPVELTDAYREVTVDALTGRAAGPDCPPERRRLERRVALAPRYAAWAKASGLELMPLDAPDPAGLLAARPELAVLSPRHDARYVGDPETPAAQSTIALEAAVWPPAPQVAWYVDGRLLCVADYPYTTRWRIAPGEHAFQVGLPYAPVRSPPVRVRVGALD